MYTVILTVIAAILKIQQGSQTPKDSWSHNYCNKIIPMDMKILKIQQGSQIPKYSDLFQYTVDKLKCCFSHYSVNIWTETTI